MSATDSQNIARSEHLETPGSRLRSWSRWPKWLLLLLFLLWIAAEGISLLIQHSRLPRKFTARLETAFGRPVEVGSYDFGFWGGPVLEARSVTVAEDPRFGREYFLRADSMAIRLRWQSLLRGRIELGTLSLTRPSLNLVRNSSGNWNLAEWLPRPSGTSVPGAPSGASAAASAVPRFRRIEVDGGRINFKRGDDKLPFALVGVAGAVETDGPGRWRMNLEVTPWRAAVAVQDAGTIRISGHVGGTSSRLRPAALDVSWTDASLADVLRLARGDDYGVRGQLALWLNAGTQDQGNGWSAQGRAEMRQIHRWDLALRPDNPAVNLITRLEWRPPAPYVELTEALLEAPHSNARVSGRLEWNAMSALDTRELSALQFAVSSAQIDMGDLLAWVRAFQPGVADNLSVRGLAEAHATVSGWPLQVVDAAVSSEGVDISGARLRAPAHLGPVRFRYVHGIVSVLPVLLSWRVPGGTPDGSFRLDVPAQPVRAAPLALHAAGSTRDIRDLLAMAGAFGSNISSGWELAGPLACDLRWQGAPPGNAIPRLPIGGQVPNGVFLKSAPLPWHAQPTGWIELGAPTGGASLRAPFLNQPIDQIKARADLTATSRYITLSSAQAFGARWTGSFDRREPDALWRFALSADRLAVADLDRSLNPRWRESFLGRMLPFLNSRPPAIAIPENLRANGRLSLGQFTLAPLLVRHLQGDLKIDGRHVEFTNAAGQFYGGALTGSLDAHLDAAPSYNVSADFSRVDVSALSATSPDLAGFFAGSASGEASFHARGATRDALVSSLTCRGTARILGPELRNIDLLESLRAASRRRGVSAFREASAAFTCAGGKLQFQDLLMTGPDETIDGIGTIDFRRNLDLRLQAFSRSAATRAAPAPVPSGATYQVTGSLAAPQIKRLSTPPRPPR